MDNPPRLLTVNLTEKKISVLELDAQTVRKYVGGSGLAAKLLWDRTGPETDPLSGDNPLLFMIGPLTGTPVPYANRVTIAAVSPLTGIWGESHAGGTWSHTLGHTPYSGIIVEGNSEKPVYLNINNDRTTIEDAGEVWGRDTFETSDTLISKSDAGASVLAIGPAGERLIKLAAVVSDGKMARMAARCGLGAVMGAKKLKAIVVRGTGHRPVHDTAGLKMSISRHFPKTQFDAERYWKRLADALRGHAEHRGCIRNWTSARFPGFGEKYFEFMKGSEPYFCAGCRTSCNLSLTRNGQRYLVGQVTLPFGPNCLIDSLEAIAAAYEICNRQGLDGTSTGQAMALAFELYGKGLITSRDTDGIELDWGNDAAMLQMLDKVVNREGFGRLMGEGTRAMIAAVGGDAAGCAAHVKGLEFPNYDPRTNNAIALQYATANRGADHVDGFAGLYRYSANQRVNDYAQYYLKDDTARKAADKPFVVQGKAGHVAWSQDFDCLLDCLTVCKFLARPHSWVREALPLETFPGVRPEQLLEWFNLVTGEGLDLAEFMAVGERGFNLKRLFNVRRGISRKDDTLPPRFLKEKRGGEGQSATHLPELELMLDEYYHWRGWNREGIPTREKLTRLGLQKEADALYSDKT